MGRVVISTGAWAWEQVGVNFDMKIRVLFTVERRGTMVVMRVGVLRVGRIENKKGGRDVTIAISAH